MGLAPKPSLPSADVLAQQQNTLLRVNYAAPDRTDSKYLRHSMQQLEPRMFNGLMRSVYRAAISGVQLVFDKTDRNGLLAAYNGREDLAEIYVVADTIVIAAPLVFPQTDVFLFARELRFEGPNSSIATQPREWQYRDPLDINGADGAKAGNINLYACQFTPAQGAVRKYFNATGGRGQNPDAGGFKPSDKFRTLSLLTKQQWDGVFTYNNRKLIHEEGSHGGLVFYYLKPEDFPAPSFDEWSAKCNGKIVYVELNNRHYCNAFHTVISDVEVVASAGTRSDPGVGGDALPPGQPGSGGAGGTLTTTVDVNAAYYDLGGGPSGTRHPGAGGGPGGSPQPSYWVFFSGSPDGSGHPIRPQIAERVAIPGRASGPGPAPKQPQGTNGSYRRVPPNGLPLLAPTLFGLVLQYARDCMVAGHAGIAASAIKPYLDAAQALVPPPQMPAEVSAEVLGGSLTLAQVIDEAKTLIDQTASPVDLYGNPPGWTPSLSLETAAAIYENVLQNSLQELYAGYCLEKAWNDKADKAVAVKNLLDVVGERTREAQKGMTEARAQIGPLMGDMKQLLQEMEIIAKALRDREQELRAEADKKLLAQEQKDAIAAGFKISSALLKAFPLPEPAHTIASGAGAALDITASFMESGGDDEAFKSLKTSVDGFADSPGLAAALNRDLEADIAGVDSSVKELGAAAEAAKEEKAKIDGTYGKRLAALETAKADEEKLINLKKEAGKIATGAPDAKTEKWLDIEIERTKAEKALREKNKAREGIDKDIASQKTELDRKKTDLEAKKKERDAEVKKRIGQVKDITAGIETIGKTLNKLMVSQSRLNSRHDQMLAGLQSADSQFLALTKQIGLLAERKQQITTRMLKLQADLTAHKQLISKNLVVDVELRSQLAKSSGVLDPAALVYIQSLSQDAHRDLQKFLYYVVKAYEYYMVQPYAQSYLNAQRTFESLRRILEPADFNVDFPPGAGEDSPEARQKRLEELIKKPAPAKLSRTDFELLKLVYERPLREMGKELAGQLMNGASRIMDAHRHITLTAADLKELNDRIPDITRTNAIPFNLVRLRQVESTRERQRIRNIRVATAACRKLGDRFPDQVIFKFTHMGKSIVRADGKFFTFEPEARVAQSHTAVRTCFETDGGVHSKGRWEVTKEDAAIGKLSGESLWQPPVSSQANLLQKLLNAKELIPLSQFRPGIFSDFVLSVEFQPAGSAVTFDELGLEVELEVGQAPQPELFVCACTDLGLAVPIAVDRPDKGGRSGGVGTYTGVWDQNGLQNNPIRLSVPPRYGEYAHTGWLRDGVAVPDAGKPLEVFKSSFVTATYARTSGNAPNA